MTTKGIKGMKLKSVTKWWGGIDNGLTGGLVFISNRGTVKFYPMPTLTITGKRSKKTGKYGIKKILDIASLKEIFLIYKDLLIMVTVEAMQVSGGGGKFHQSATSIATSHRNGGIIIGLLVGMEIPYQEVSATVWQKSFFKTKLKKDTKIMSYTHCCKLYPDLTQYFKSPRGAIKDGLCDALLLATYGKT